jgi:hypothetical protein
VVLTFRCSCPRQYGGSNQQNTGVIQQDYGQTSLYGDFTRNNVVPASEASEQRRRFLFSALAILTVGAGGAVTTASLWLRRRELTQRQFSLRRIAVAKPSWFNPDQ